MSGHIPKLDTAQKSPLLQSTFIQKKKAIASVFNYRLTPWFLCPLLKSMMQKVFQKSKKVCFSPQITLSKLKNTNACFYSMPSVQSGKTLLMFIKLSPVAGEYKFTEIFSLTLTKRENQFL